MNPSGIHVPNNARPRQWGKLLDIPWSCFTILHQQLDRVPELRAKFPTATILVRAYTPIWYNEDPVAWAQFIARWAKELELYRIAVTFANEQIFISEYGGYPMDHPTGAEQYKKWLDQIAGVDYIQGATAFIWDSDEVNADWTIQSKPALVSMFRNYQPPAVHVEPVEPETPAGILPLAKARWYVEDAMRKLEGKERDAAHNIMTETVIDWFYYTARENSTDLENARAHTAARWWCEEAARKIEKNDLTAAHDMLRDHVRPWLYSAGPSALGILSAEPAPAAKAPKKKRTAQKARPKKNVAAKKSAAKKASKKPRLGSLSVETEMGIKAKRK